MVTGSSGAFSALSSLAMDELYSLEREEAARRAEYEVRHARALRRLEHAGPRVSEPLPAPTLARRRASQSAGASPAGTPFFSGAPEGGYFGMTVSHERTTPQGGASGHTSRSNSGEDLAARGYAGRAARRLSGPALHMTPSLEAHAVDSAASTPHAHARAHTSWAHPYAPHTHAHAQYAQYGRGPPSPDSDRDPASPDMGLPTPLPGRGAYSAGPTPSTSPFLGPLRRLQIASAAASRAPSPELLLPPAALDSSRRGSAGPLALAHAARAASAGNLAALLTPQLSSGPSSGASSPHAARSRAPSPHRMFGGGHGLGMTPIHSPRSPPIVLAPLKAPEGEGVPTLPGFRSFEADAGWRR